MSSSNLHSSQSKDKSLPPIPLPSFRSSLALDEDNPAMQKHPQPHYHRYWHRTCLHWGSPVNVPFTETGPGSRLCMCDTPEEYYLEEVSKENMHRIEELDVVEQFWSGSDKLNKEKRSSLGRDVLEVVKKARASIGEKEKKKKKKEAKRKVLRWVPRMRRVEGRCTECENKHVLEMLKS